MRTFLWIAVASLCLCQDAADPWQKSELMEPSALAARLQEKDPPTVICTAFENLYKLKRISHAIYAGPGSKPEGIEMLKKAVANLPKNSDLVIYCGCCPMVRCPNIRPAYRTLKELGFTRVRVLSIPTNMHTDWYTKNYPSEEGAGN